MSYGNRFKEWLGKIWTKKGAPLPLTTKTGNAWCGIFRDTKSPCSDPAVCLMRYTKAEARTHQRGFAEAIFVCAFHHPDKSHWTRRHFELKGYRITSVEELPPCPAA